MWKIILFLLLATASFSEATDYDCYQNSYLACGAHDVPTHFPETRSELRRICKIEIKFLKCVIRFKEKCDEDLESIRVHRDLLDATRDMCDRDNPNYSVVVDSLVCVKPIFDDNAIDCFNSYPGPKKARKYAKALRSQDIIPFPRDKEARKECTKGLYIFACEALKIEEKCGSDALYAFLKMIQARTMKFTGSCDQDVISDNLLRIVRTVEMQQLLEEFDDLDDYE